MWMGLKFMLIFNYSTSFYSRNVQGQNVQHGQRYKKAGSIYQCPFVMKYSWWFIGLNYMKWSERYCLPAWAGCNVICSQTKIFWNYSKKYWNPEPEIIKDISSYLTKVLTFSSCLALKRSENRMTFFLWNTKGDI